MNTRSNTLTWLYNPFYFVAGAKALTLGIITIDLTALIAYMGNVHFDGVLDMHMGRPGPMWLFFAESIIDWLAISLVLWAGGRLISKSSIRGVDVFGTQALARWPMLFVSIIAMPKPVQNAVSTLVAQLTFGSFQFNPAGLVLVLVFAASTLFLLCLMVVLMYQGFCVSCNVRGGKAIGVFIAGLLIAEVISKLALFPLVERAYAAPGPSVQEVQPTASSQTNSGAISAQSELSISQMGEAFVDHLAKGEFALAANGFDETMTRVMPEASMAKSWKDLALLAGAYQRRIETTVQTEQGYQIALVTCQFERTRLNVRVVFDANRQVAGLFYQPAAK